ncbi:MAG: DUF4143 domain-containing protein [Propionibacteriaceae bacterium]|nr:DUF4143 domain-containing protein [Propionibacteriaceae bacterium]
MNYESRLVDDTLDRWLPELPAIAIEGAKGVGKTATASQRASETFSLDRTKTRLRVADDPEIILASQPTTFIDEWQLVPDVWDVVRRAVDDGAQPGRFLLAGSAGLPKQARVHSGAGRIVRLVMRPMSLPERQIENPSVSLADLLTGRQPTIGGTTGLTTPDYVDEILRSGFPGIRQASPSIRDELLDSYVDRIIDHDIVESGARVRRPATLRGWLAAYGAATATTASYASILQSATPGEDIKPAKLTGMVYRGLLQRLWVLDPLPAWVPTFAHLDRLGQSPKHHLVDPSLAARLAGATKASLIRGEGPSQNDDAFLGALFESLAVQTIRVLAQAHQARTSHMRLQGGDHEIDIIIERADLRVVAVEVKVSPIVRPADVAHLNWLDKQLPGRVADKVIVNTGERAYRRPDGVAVVPLGLLGQ